MLTVMALIAGTSYGLYRLGRFTPPTLVVLICVVRGGGGAEPGPGASNSDGGAGVVAEVPWAGTLFR